MTEEIKEIDLKKDFYLCSPLLNKECTKESCYINNGCCCHTVNKKYSQEHLLNHITNLQKENEILQKDNESLKHFYNDLVNKYENLIERYQDYKQRNEKAIKWLENHIKMINGLAGNNDGLKGSIVLSDDVVVNSLLYILQGGDE